MPSSSTKRHGLTHCGGWWWYQAKMRKVTNRSIYQAVEKMGRVHFTVQKAENVKYRHFWVTFDARMCHIACLTWSSLSWRDIIHINHDENSARRHRDQVVAMVNENEDIASRKIRHSNDKSGGVWETRVEKRQKPRKVFSCGFIVKHEKVVHDRIWKFTSSCVQPSMWMKCSSDSLRWREDETKKCEHVESVVCIGASGTSWEHFLSVFVLSKIRFLMLLSDNYAIHLTKLQE